VNKSSQHDAPAVVYNPVARGNLATTYWLFPTFELVGKGGGGGMLLLTINDEEDDVRSFHDSWF